MALPLTLPKTLQLCCRMQLTVVQRDKDVPPKKRHMDAGGLEMLLVDQKNISKNYAARNTCVVMHCSVVGIAPPNRLC